MNFNVEQAVIGSMLWNGECLEKGLRLLEPDDFVESNNVLLFDVIKDVKKKNLNPGLIIVADEISKRQKINKKEAVLSYLADVVKNEGISAQFDNYVLSLLEDSKRRKLGYAGGLLRDQSGNMGREVSEIILDIEKKIRGITSVDPFVTNGDEFKSIQDLQTDEGEYLKTGFKSIDDLIYGLCKGELVILAARPSVGKTALALNIARNVSESKGVIFYSLEMSEKDLRLRLVASDCEINMNRIKFNIIDDIERKGIEKSYQSVRNLNLCIKDSSNLSVNDITNLSLQQGKNKRVDFIVVDYLTLLKTSGDKNRYLQIGEITRGLKRLAKEMQVPVLLLAQLGRGVEARDKQVPRLSDLRESGDIEQDADKVLFLYQQDRESEEIELLIAKNRNGPAGKVQLKFLKQFTKFIDW